MDLETKKAMAFWIGCIGTRVGVTWLAAAHHTLLPYLGAIASIIAAGFTVIYLGDLRQTGPEVFGGRIWWNYMRPLHATLYGIFAYLAIQGHPGAWKILGIDVILGIMAKLIS